MTPPIGPTDREAAARSGLRMGVAILAAVILLASLIQVGVPVHRAVRDLPLATITTLVLAAVLVGWRRLDPLTTRVREIIFDSPRRGYNGVLFIAGTTVFAVLSHRLFQAVPHMDDSVAALYQARLFLQGHILWPVDEAIQPFFKVFGIISPANRPDTWCGMYPPAWSALLAAGLAGGLPWLVNPLLGGALAVAVTELGETLYDRQVGRLAGLLVILSPFVGVLTATHLSHTATALFCTLGWWAAVRLLATGRTRFGWLAGLSFAVAFLCRPATTLLVGVALAVGLVWPPSRALRAWRGLLVIVALMAAAAGALAAYQGITTGDPRTPGHVVEMQSTATFGFGPIGDTGHSHTPGDALRYAGIRLAALNHHLLGWPVPTLLIVLAPFLLLRARARDAWLLAPLATLLAFFALFWYFEDYFPGRYLCAATPMLLIGAARGWQVISEVGGSIVASVSRRLGWSGARADRVPAALLVWCLFFAALAGAPHYHRFITPAHGDVEHVLPQVVRSYGIENALVFMESVNSTQRWYDRRNDYYATGFQLNDLDLDGDVVFAREAGSDRRITRPNEFLLERYPDRTYYLYQFDRGMLRGRLFRYQVENGRILGRKQITPHDDLLIEY